MKDGLAREASPSIVVGPGYPRRTGLVVSWSPTRACVAAPLRAQCHPGRQRGGFPIYRSASWQRPLPPQAEVAGAESPPRSRRPTTLS